MSNSKTNVEKVAVLGFHTIQMFHFAFWLTLLQNIFIWMYWINQTTKQPKTYLIFVEKQDFRNSHNSSGNGPNFLPRVRLESIKPGPSFSDNTTYKQTIVWMCMVYWFGTGSTWPALTELITWFKMKFQLEFAALDWQFNSKLQFGVELTIKCSKLKLDFHFESNDQLGECGIHPSSLKVQ